MPSSGLKSTEWAENAFVPAYRWACAIDDFDGNYRLLVRASDLKSAAETQRSIQSWVSAVEGQGPSSSAIFHTALVVQEDGHRLEKRTQGVTLPELLGRGFSIAELLRRFEESFDPGLLRATFDSAALMSEKRELLRLSELGIF